MSTSKVLRIDKNKNKKYSYNNQLSITTEKIIYEWYNIAKLNVTYKNINQNLNINMNNYVKLLIYRHYTYIDSLIIENSLS
jgi:hypothetical protein